MGASLKRPGRISTPPSARLSSARIRRRSSFYAPRGVGTRADARGGVSGPARRRGKRTTLKEPTELLRRRQRDAGQHQRIAVHSTPRPPEPLPPRVLAPGAKCLYLAQEFELLGRG